jgi:hypothetical protein
MIYTKMKILMKMEAMTNGNMNEDRRDDFDISADNNEAREKNKMAILQTSLYRRFS